MGYDSTSAPTQILRYRKVKQKKQEFYQIVLSVSPFYAEMGGQVGDRGTLSNDDETIEIYDTKRENGLPVHLSLTLPADPRPPSPPLLTKRPVAVHRPTTHRHPPPP